MYNLCLLAKQQVLDLFVSSEICKLTLMGLSTKCLAIHKDGGHVRSEHYAWKAGDPLPICNEMQRVYLLHSMFGRLQIAIILRDLHYFECVS